MKTYPPCAQHTTVQANVINNASAAALPQPVRRVRAGGVWARQALWALLALVLALAGAVAWADDDEDDDEDDNGRITTIYGPKQAQINPKNNRSDRFSDIATYSPGRKVQGPFALVITNNSPAFAPGKRSSLEILHNYDKVVDTQDLFTAQGQPIATLTQRLDVRPYQNVLVVKISGNAPVRLSYQIVAGKGLKPSKPKIISINPNPLGLAVGTSAVVTVVLSPAPRSDGKLELESSQPSVARVASRVAFAAGQTSVAVPVSGLIVGTARVSAELNDSKASTSVNVYPAAQRVVALLPAQAQVQQGASAEFVLQVAPPTAANAVLSLSSSNPAVLTVPASVSLSAGQSTASFSAQALAVGNAQISASLNSAGLLSSAAAQVQVVPTPPKVVAILPPTSVLQKGSAATLQVQLSTAQSTTTSVTLSARAPGIVALPALLLVPPGQSQASFELQGLEVGSTWVAAALNGSSVEAAVQVTPAPASLTSLLPSTSTLVLGSEGRLLVNLNAAQSVTTTVALAAQPAGVVQVPAQVDIPPGQTQASVSITPVAIGQAQVLASLGGATQRASVQVAAPPVALAALLPSTLDMQQGASALVTVRLNATQPQASVVELAVTNAQVLRVPANVTVPAGSVEASFSVQALAPGNAQLSASINGSTKAIQVNVTPPPPGLASLQPATQDLPKGKLGRLRLELDRVPNTQVVVQLSNSNPSALGLPAQLTVPAGQLSAEVAMTALDLGVASVTASLNNTQASASVSVVAAEVVAITLSPSAIDLSPGQSAQVQALATYSDGSTGDISSAGSTTWSVGSPTIASVSAQGRVSGVSQGQTSVQAQQPVLPTYGNPSPSPVTGWGTVTVGTPGALAMATGNTHLQVGQTATVSITAPYAAGAQPYTVNFSTSGSGALQVPASATIGPGLVSVNVQVRASAAGTVLLQASAPPFTSAQLSFSVLDAPVTSVSISGISPTSAAVGALVSLTGAGFASPASNNTVVFTGSAPAVVLSGSSTELRVKVPDAAQSGPISVSNALGQAQSSVFTVLREQDFGLTASPAVLKVVQNSNAVATLNLLSSGSRAYQGLASMSVSGLPQGVSASFEPATLSAYQVGKLIVQASPSAPLGTAQITVRAQATLDGLPWVRENNVRLEVLSGQGVTGIKGRFITPAGAGIAGVIVRQDTSTNQVVSDAAGNFTLLGLPSGVTTLRFDATPANPLYPIWPYNVTLEAGQLLTASDWVINPPPADDKFITINNASQEQRVSDPRYPGFEVVLPAGASITGWDGVKKTRIAVERIEPDKLPVGAPPFAMKEAYQLYFGTPMGGIPSQPIPVTLPNVAERDPGEKVEIWWFDGSPMGGSGEWKMAGLGTVSADGKTVASDPGVGLPRFCGVCGLVSLNCPPPPKPPEPPPTCPPPSAGNPVDLFTGQELPSTSGLSCGGRTPVETGLKYNPVDAFNNRAGTIASFGYGWTFDYDISFLPFAGVQKRLVMPGGQFINMVDDGSGKYRPVNDPRYSGTYAQDAGGGKWEVLLKDGTRWLFEPFAGITGVIRGGPPLFLTRITDPNGNAITIARQSNGRIQSVSAPEGRGMSFDYGADGFVTKVRDHTGRETRYEYTNVVDAEAILINDSVLEVPGIPNNQKRIKSFIDAAGKTTTYTYTRERATPWPLYVPPPPPPGGGGGGGGGSTGSAILPPPPPPCWDAPSIFRGVQILQVQYPWASQPTVNTYSSSGRVVEQQAADGRKTKFAYSYVGACAQRLKPNSGSLYEYCFNRDARAPDGTQPASLHTKLSGMACPAFESEETRAAGWQFFGGVNVETQVSDSLGNTRRYKFNPRGMPIEVIDELGQSTRNIYDAKQQLIKTIDPLGRETRYEYDALGNQTARIDPLGRSTQTSYDPVLNKPSAFSSALLGVPSVQGGQNLSYTPVIQSLAYDSKGNVIASTDPTGLASRISYDAQGQISELTLPALTSASTVPVINAGVSASMPKANRKLKLGYNSAGDIALLSDAQGNETSFTSDALGRTTGQTDPLGYSSTSQYNVLDQLTQATNPLGQQTRQEYDSAGRLSAVVNAAGVTLERYSYDGQGRLSRITDALGQASNIAYDANGRVSQITDRKGQTSSISYDPRGRVSQIDKPGQSISYQYDALGRLVQVRDANTVSTHQYDEADRITQIDTATAAGSHRLSYQYDSLDRVTRRTLSGTGITTAETTDYSYDLAGRLLGHSTNAGGQPHSSRYEYDSAGRLAARRVQAGTTAQLITQRYGYDSAERLVQIKYIKAEGTAGEQLIEQIDYQYDAKGQRTAKSTLNNNGVGVGETPMTASYDAANRMNAVTLSIGGSTKTYSLSYDANGNLTQKANTSDPSDQTTYTWDANDRLVQIVQSGQNGASLNASFSYDVFGRRIQSTITRANQSPATVQYLYEGAQALGEIRDGRLSHRLLTGLSLDETIARIAINANGQKDAANSRIYLTDALNSVIAQLGDDDNANIANSYGYSPYGQSSTVGPDAAGNPVQYTSRENDAQGATGLYYYRARYYDPVLKRFVSEDPIGLQGGINVYGYVDGSPLMYTDPLGLQAGPASHNTGGSPNSRGPDICSGRDCSIPPYDPTPDGPTPAPGAKKPKNRNDNSASGAFCERYDDTPVKQWFCEKCVNFACSFGGSSALCCMEAHRQCVISAATNGKDANQCAAQLMTCNAFGGRGNK